MPYVLSAFFFFYDGKKKCLRACDSCWPPYNGEVNKVAALVEADATREATRWQYSQLPGRFAQGTLSLIC